MSRAMTTSRSAPAVGQRLGAQLDGHPCPVRAQHLELEPRAAVLGSADAADALAHLDVALGRRGSSKKERSARISSAGRPSMRSVAALAKTIRSSSISAKASPSSLCARRSAS